MFDTFFFNVVPFFPVQLNTVVSLSKSTYVQCNQQSVQISILQFADLVLQQTTKVQCFHLMTVNNEQSALRRSQSC